MSVLCTFHRQRVSEVFQCSQEFSILRHAVAIGEGSSKLGLLSSGPPFLFDTLLAISGGSGT